MIGYKCDMCNTIIFVDPGEERLCDKCKGIEKLKEIEDKLNKIAELKEPLKTKELVRLMDYMQANYKVIIINPTKEQLESPEVKLYRKISEMRD